MRAAVSVLALLGLAAAQDIDFDAVNAAPDLSVLGPDMANPIPPANTYNPTVAAASAAAEATTASTNRSLRFKRTCGVNDSCCPQPDGYGPKTSDPDTADAFLANPVYSEAATNAHVPQGYTRYFENLNGATQQNGYLTFTSSLKTYDTIKCQQLCDTMTGCVAFNIYYERDPTVKPAEACPNPASFTNIKCSFYGLPICADSATNTGQYRKDFQVVVAGSNGYGKNPPPPAYNSFDGPMALGGAINAPLNSAGKNTYMGMGYYNGPYDPMQCASACQAKTAYNQRHPASDGTYRACNFFNSYVLSKNNVPQGTYCAFYTQSWDKEYATNYGQYRGSDYYSVSQSYAYTLNPQDLGLSTSGY